MSLIVAEPKPGGNVSRKFLALVTAGSLTAAAFLPGLAIAGGETLVDHFAVAALASIKLGAGGGWEFNEDTLNQGAAARAAAPQTLYQATYRLPNFGYTLQPGEPTFGGRMTRTGWIDLRVPKAAQVVVHTFGSGYDTVLAAYTGTKLADLKQIAAADDTPVSGLVAGKESLVRFEAAANATYHIQFGGRKNAEGPTAANIFALPPGGGLSAFLYSVSGNQSAGRGSDYLCQATSSATCGNPTFILYNSTTRLLRVTSSNSLDARLVSPAPINLPAKTAAAVTFTFAATFDHASPRTISGQFTFTARSGTTVVGAATRPGILTIRKTGTLPDVVRLASVTPQMRAGLLNQRSTFRVTLTNSGAATVHGCYIYPYDSDAHAIWQRVRPADDTPVGGANAPATIGAGQSQTFLVTLWKQASKFSYFPPSGPWKIDCWDTVQLNSVDNTLQDFDLYGAVHEPPPDVAATVLAPTADTLVVPAASAAMRVAALNKGAASKVEVTAKYEYPFADAANRRFTVTLCEMASASGACLQPASANAIVYTAAANATHYFKVFVKRPAANPGFDPAKRRIFIYFRGVVPPQTFGSISVGAESVAPRWH